jgi:phosphatidylinositol alpha-1,6-mannosyltransferase
VRVLFVTPGCFDKGGISRYSRYQLRALRELLGPENVRSLSMMGPDGDSIEEPFSVTWHGGGVGMRDKVRFAIRAAVEALRWRPQVVHCALLNQAGIGAALSRLVGARFVLNIYGLEVWSDKRWDAAWGTERADVVISDCHFTARYFRDSQAGRGVTPEVIWDCVDVEKFRPGVPRAEVLERYGIPGPGSGVNLLTLGRLSADAAYKGYERLLEAFGLAAPSVPQLRLVVAGKGALGEVLRQRAGAMGLADRVFFTGMVREEDLGDVYRSAHVFSLVGDRGPSRGEGIPLTPLEAAACGVPVLVGDQDGSREAVEHGATGWALDPFDLNALAGAVTKLARDRERRALMGAAGRARIEREFAYPIFRERHRTLLESWRPDGASRGGGTINAAPTGRG